MKTKMKPIQLFIALFCIVIALASVTQLFAQKRGKPELTDRIYSDKIELERALQKELGREYSLGDWNDVKSIRNLDRWIKDMRLKDGCEFLLTRNGNATSIGTQHYFVHYSEYGEPPAGFRVHDKLEGRFFLCAGSDINAYILVLNNSRKFRDFKMREVMKGRDNRPSMKDDRNVRDNYPPVKDDRSSRNNLYLTRGIYSENIDLERALQKELGKDYSIADWNDLKSIRDIDEWIASSHLRNGQTFMVTRDGKENYSGKRHYFVHYSSTGRPPAGFLVHDKIGRKLFLGSWYGESRSILSKRIR
jgi:hypothetical protein